MVGAGLGWLVGAGLGEVVSEDARPPGPVGRRLLLGAACVFALSAVAIAIKPVSSGWPETELTFFSLWSQPGGAALVIIIMIDAAIACATFLLGGRRGGFATFGSGSLAVETIGVTGLVLGGLVFASGVTLLLNAGWDTVADEQSEAVLATTGSLQEVVQKHLDRTGSFPPNLAEVLAAGGRVQPGTQVEFAGVVNGSFCVRVGVDVGEERADDPHWSALVHLPPPGSNDWTSEEMLRGNSCTSGDGTVSRTVVNR
jgi:hypothetical protein